MNGKPVVEQRRAKRFEMRLPIRVVRNGMRSSSAAGETRNLSSGGVFFVSDTRVEAGEPIEYTIHLLPSPESPQRVWLRCLGKVTRAQASPASGSEFEVAATLERYEFVRAQE